MFICKLYKFYRYLICKKFKVETVSIALRDKMNKRFFRHKQTTNKQWQRGEHGEPVVNSVLEMFCACMNKSLQIQCVRHDLFSRVTPNRKEAA